MQWTDDCSVGIPELDEQQKHLFDCFVFVKDTLAEGGGWNDMHAALAALTRSFEFCSAVEEALMQIHAYPERECHKNEHMDLRSSLEAMEKANLTSGLTEKMIRAAFAATMQHHLTQDRHYVRYLPQALESV
jgi:hemerythrin-like metal-binding protein